MVALHGYMILSIVKTDKNTNNLNRGLYNDGTCIENNKKWRSR